jgi:S-formylglutathione hydrolase FrmB
MKINKILLLLFLSLAPLIINAQETKILKSGLLPANDTIYIFKPQNYNSTQKYAAVYLLHGWSGNYKQWSNITDLQAYANLYNFIIVCPDGFYDSWYLNSTNEKSWQYQSFFFNELYPYILANYPVDNNNIFISGLSMGGHGAINLFIDHPELFKAAGSTSGVLDLEAKKINFGLSRLLGKIETNKENWHKNSAIQNLDKLKDINKPLFIDCGLSDGFFNMNKNFVDKAIALNIPITFSYTQGNHSATYWNKSIAQQFAFFYKCGQ